MHEFSIAMSIIELAEEEARKAKASTVSELVLEIGTMAGIEFYALDTAIEAAVRGTMLEKASIIVDKIQASARCSECGHVFPIQQVYDACPQCNSLYHELLQGKELKIKSLVVETPDG
jgi:hydrogenase nickel incorporation protein HypA/HybF